MASIMISKDLDRIGAFQDRDEAKVGLVTNRIKAGKKCRTSGTVKIQTTLEIGVTAGEIGVTAGQFSQIDATRTDRKNNSLS